MQKVLSNSGLLRGQLRSMPCAVAPAGPGKGVRLRGERGCYRMAVETRVRRVGLIGEDGIVMLSGQPRISTVQLRIPGPAPPAAESARQDSWRALSAVPGLRSPADSQARPTPRLGVRPGAPA